MTESETVINLNEETVLFSNDKGQIGRLQRLGLPIKKQNGYGVWFDLSQAIVTVKVNKIRGSGYKEEVLT